MSHWTEDANCRGVDPEAFYAPDAATRSLVERICGNCPVQTRCRMEALATGEAWSFRGGEWFGADEGPSTEQWRRRERRSLSRAASV
jgi:hypothetical protein